MERQEVEGEAPKKVFLLAAKKRKRTAMMGGSGSNYLISIDFSGKCREMCSAAQIHRQGAQRN